MAEELKQNNLKEPEFDASSPHFFKLTISKNATDHRPGLEFNERQLKAIEYLKKQPQITSVDYQALTNTSKATAHRDLTDLVKKGQVVKRGFGQATTYVVPEN